MPRINKEWMMPCRFCSHTPCICNEYLVTAEEAEKWWRAFAGGARGINASDLRRLVITVASMHERQNNWPIEAMTIDEAMAEMSEHCREIRINAERIASARRCAEIAREIAEACESFDEESKCLAIAKEISREFGLDNLDRAAVSEVSNER